MGTWIEALMVPLVEVSLVETTKGVVKSSGELVAVTQVGEI